MNFYSYFQNMADFRKMKKKTQDLKYMNLFHGEWKPRNPVLEYLYFQKPFKNFKYIICLSQENFIK